MVNRFQHIFLKTKTAALIAGLLSAQLVYADDATTLDIKNEIFQIGISGGILNVEDFNSEFTPRISASFRASEDFFIQYNYLEKKLSLSPYEKSQGKLVDGDDRQFRHYDLLLGYNLFQGEFFPSSGSSKADLSTLYLVAGVGETKFGGEANISYTLGVGYEIALTRHLGVCFDFRDYIYRSGLITDHNRKLNTTEISTGLKFSF